MDVEHTSKLLPLNKAALMVGLPVAFARREAKAGRLPCVRVGRQLLADPVELRRAAEADYSTRRDAEVRRG